MSTAPQIDITRATWRSVKLGEILTLINGRAYKKDEERDSGTPVMRIQNLNGGDRWFYSDLSLPEDKYCDKGDLLFAWSATFGPYIWWGKKVIYHYHIWKIECGPELDKKFAYHLLQHITERVKAAGRGISMIHMTKGGMEDWDVSIPPLDEQKRIAAILDQADELRRKRQRAIDRLGQLGQAIFHDMFGDPVANPHRFKSEYLTRAFDFTTGKLDSNAAVNGGQYPFFTCAKEVFSIDKFAFDCEALLLAGNNASAIYDVKYYHGKFNAYQRTYVIQVNEKYDLSYLYAKISLENLLKDMKRFSKGSNTKYLTMGILSRMAILIPPISLQREFEKVYKEILEDIKVLQTAMAAHMKLFASLQYRAFRGEL